MQVVGAAGQRLAVEPDLVRLSATPSSSVSVSFQMLRRGGDVERAVVPQDALSGNIILSAKTVPCRTCRRRSCLRGGRRGGASSELLVDLLVRPGRVGDVEPALVVEVGDDRAVPAVWTIRAGLVVVALGFFVATAGEPFEFRKMVIASSCSAP